MGNPEGFTKVMPVFDFDTGVGVDQHPANGLYFADTGGHVIVSPDRPLPVTTAFEGGFSPATSGKLFHVTNNIVASPSTVGPTTVASLLAASGFARTFPTFILRNSLTRRILVRDFNLLTLANPGSDVNVLVVLDPSDRYVAATGTAHAIYNMNSGSVVAATSTFFSLPTATAEAGTQRYITTTLVPKAPAASINIAYEDGLIIGAPGAVHSLLVYSWVTAGGAATWLFNFDFEEIV